MVQVKKDSTSMSRRLLSVIHHPLDIYYLDNRKMTLLVDNDEDWIIALFGHRVYVCEIALRLMIEVDLQFFADKCWQAHVGK